MPVVVSWVGVFSAAVPSNRVVKVFFDGPEMTDRLPFAAPLLCGANVTVKVKLSPPLNLKGNSRPLRLNSAPVELSSVTVRLDLPRFVIVTNAFFV